MHPFPKTRFLCVSLLLLLQSFQSVDAQQLLPSVGERQQYTVNIEMSRGYISGVGIMKNDGEQLLCCVFNEFGVSAIDFTYDLRKHKVKLHSVMKMLDKWYIRRVLRKDLRSLLEKMSHGESVYENVKRNITYRFEPLKIED
ncbi:MAG: hypothetical protein IKT00_12395 [Prevotella sp.]|nr:hypothetical protein [Prevotella sp.]